MGSRLLSDYEKVVYGRWSVAKPTTDAEQIRESNLVAGNIVKHQDRYIAAGSSVGIPFWVIGCLHFRESSSRFDCHLHNGDPLSARTVHVPQGRPVGGNPPFTWEESAADALSLRGLNNLTWDNISSLVRMEAWNGFGYRKLNLVSPYVWSYTDQYSAGKFVADGKFDPAFVDKQPGCAAIMLALKALGVDLNEVTPG